MRRILKFLLFPILALIAVTTLTAYTLFNTSHRPSTAVMPKEQLIPHAGQVREIASIDPLSFVFGSSEEVVKGKIRSTLTQNCQNPLAAQDVATDQVMIKFVGCSNSIIAAKSRLVNVTNSYAAHLFKAKNSELSTDFIQLKKGENILTFEISLNDGQKKTQIIKINRIQ